MRRHITPHPFGIRLKELRLKAVLSQRALAELICVSFTYISKIETGGSPPPSCETIAALANILQVPVEELLLLAGKTPPADLRARLRRVEKELQLIRAQLDQQTPPPIMPPYQELCTELLATLTFHQEVQHTWVYPSDQDGTLPTFADLYLTAGQMATILARYERAVRPLLSPLTEPAILPV